MSLYLEFELFMLINLCFVVFFLLLYSPSFIFYYLCWFSFMTASKSTILQYLDHFIANAKFRSISGGRIGLSVRSVANYTNFRIVFKDFETFLSGTIYFKELNKTNVDAFKHWLLIERNYSDNHAGRLMGTLKSICVDAKKNDIEVHHYINYDSAFA